VLTTLAGICAPYIPFMAESMYQNLVVGNIPGCKESVHLTDFPVCDESKIDAQLEADMDEVIQAVSLGRACRNTANIKVRQPIATLYVKGAELPEAVTELIANELNVKAVKFVTDAREFTTYELKPQMRTLGPRYGKILGKIGAHLKTMDGNDVVDAFDRGETVSFDIEGTEVVLNKDDVLTKPMQKEGFVAQVEGEMTVVLDTNLTAELIEEGYVREVVSKIQTMRKDADFDVTDRIAVTVETGDKLAAIVAKGAEEIKASVLAASLELAAAEEGAVAQEWNINGEKAVIGVKVVK
jgi:isoleucyl-tRNA synthetase